MEASAAAPATASLRSSRRLGPRPPPPSLFDFIRGHRRHHHRQHHHHHHHPVFTGRRTTPKSTTLLPCRNSCLEAAYVNVSPVSPRFGSLQIHPVLLFGLHPCSTSHSHRKFYINCIDHSPKKYANGDVMYIQSDTDPQLESLVGGTGSFGVEEASFDGGVSTVRPKRFQNRFLNFARLGSVVSNAAEAFFKSEVRRRLFVTAVLILVSRIGYFIPLPGFDRRLIPDNYLSFAAGSVDELGNFTSELKLSLFQLGISPQIAASIIMQVLCHVVPSLVKLRKEGLDGHEKIKSYIWWISLGFAIVEAVIVSCYSLQYSVYAASHRFKHVIVTSFFLVLGAMSMTWICDTISESGFGHGSSLIICVAILTGYTDTLHKMLLQLSAIYLCE